MINLPREAHHQGEADYKGMEEIMQIDGMHLHL
jgi:hypothetical protein